MSEFGKLRARMVERPAERRGVLPTLAGAAAAFAVGVLTVLAWNNLPSPIQWPSLLPGMSDSQSRPSFPGDRIGRAMTAPFLKICLTKDLLGIDRGTEIDPGLLLQILEAGSVQGRVTRILGAPREHAALELAATWGSVTDCVYRQNTWNLCDIDNRALAVDSANTFVRQADEIIAAPAAYAATPGEISELSTTKERVLQSLRERVHDGLLIAADFGFFPPAALKHVLKESEPVQNGCSKR